MMIITMELATHQYEDREVDDNDCGSEEEALVGKRVLIKQRDQGECNGPSQATICHDELVNLAEFIHSDTVGQE